MNWILKIFGGILLALAVLKVIAILLLLVTGNASVREIWVKQLIYASLFTVVGLGLIRREAK